MIHIDFETTSDCDIWTAGAWAYSCHPSTRILCIGLAIDDGPVILHSWTETSFMKNMFDEEYRAYNAFFEQCIWTNILVKRYGWPRIPLKQWRCVMAKACARALPRSLENCAKALNVAHQKDMAGKRTMLKLSKASYTPTQDELEVLYAYCKADVETERDIDRALPELCPMEQSVWFLDQLINSRGVSVDLPAVTGAISLAEEHTRTLITEIKDITGNALDGVSRRLAVMNWVKKQGVKIDGYTKKDINEILTSKVLPATVRKVLETRLELGKTSVKKYEALRSATTDDGRIRDLLLYHGAQTGRWTGKLVQIQNLPRATEKVSMEGLCSYIAEGSRSSLQLLYGDNVMDWLSQAIRGMFIASPGHTMFVADYNAIEARVLFWLANDKNGLEAYRQGKDIYVDTARVIYGKQDITKAERQLGKTAVLGCGYGMGVNKFIATCANFGYPVSEQLGEKAVGAYRHLFASVPTYWHQCESAAIYAIQTKKSVGSGRLQWKLDGDVLLCQLPSGRSIAYNSATLENNRIKFMGQSSTTTQWEAQETYGGKLVENATQAVARDILAEALLRVERAGYKVLFSVHDEIVAEVDETDRKHSCVDFVRLIEQLPPWATGCPIKAEGFETKRYCK
jgi:DNA polymerase bacteriophage-type